MNITRKCEICDTALEFEDGGRRLTFTAHDDAFCRGATRLRITTLERALQQAIQDRGETETRFRLALHRNQIESGIWREALASAVQRSASGDDLREIERLLDRHHFDAVVAAEMRARIERMELSRAFVAAGYPRSLVE